MKGQYFKWQFLAVKGKRGYYRIRPANKGSKYLTYGDVTVTPNGPPTKGPVLWDKLESDNAWRQEWYVAKNGEGISFTVSKGRVSERYSSLNRYLSLNPDQCTDASINGSDRGGFNLYMGSNAKDGVWKFSSDSNNSGVKTCPAS